MNPIHCLGMLLIAFGFLGVIGSSIATFFGDYKNPGIYIIVGAVGVVVILGSLLIERMKERRKEGTDDSSQY
ncbi:hypothetical protein BHU72_06100 [Desulfuribacillus stibiiarsenatis]|uniref:Uncharacterized protein n=1 Tax=Desulfuribacillus stibiiarsenatis TaxID=1390249 RepID=A0A1E5L4Z1_9FIRM|nr:hypothetical protein [Desulfuribacillus stibiiarsenatis]OEH85180.1 hypothetical protein BHU72_06100 [Desulfuribacillus stibiiarsenatis]